jgi:hypothetical protein
MLADGDGSPSSMRCLVFLVVIVTMFPGVVAALNTGQNFIPTPEQISMVALAIGGKLVQNNQERPPTAPA